MGIIYTYMVIIHSNNISHIIVIVTIQEDMKRLSDPVEKKMKEGKRRKKRFLYLHPKLSSGLVPI